MKKILCFILSLLLGCGVWVQQNLSYTYPDTYCRKVQNDIEENQMLYAAYVLPVVYDDWFADYAMKVISDCGINLVWQNDESYSYEYRMRILDYAWKYGMQSIICLRSYDMNLAADFVKTTLDHPGLYAYALPDEPHPDIVHSVADYTNYFKNAVPEDSSVKVLNNLHANYIFGNRESHYSPDSYSQYVKDFLLLNKVDNVSFDNYALKVTDDPEEENLNVAVLIENLATIAAQARRFGIDCSGFMQCGTDDTSMRLMSDGDIHMDMNLYASFGLNIIHYFVFADTVGVDGAIDWAANMKRDGVIYERIKNAIADMNAMKGVYLDYDWQGFTFCNFSGNMAEVRQYIPEKEVLLEEYGHFTHISSPDNSKALVGLFSNSRGTTGTYVVNMDYLEDNASKYTVEFDGMCTYRLWGRNGLSQMGRDRRVDVSLAPGDGCFVEIMR